MTLAMAIKLGLVAKKYWKEILAIILLVFGFLLMIPVVLLSVFIPIIELSVADDYKEIGNIAKISWVEMLAYDTVRYDNELQDITYNDVKNTALDFFVVNLNEYDYIEVEVEIEDDSEDDPEDDSEDKKKKPKTKTEYEKVLISSRTYNTSNGIKHMLTSLGYGNSLSGDFSKILEAFKQIDSSDYYDLTYSIKDFDDLIVNLTDEQQEWAMFLISDNTIVQMYGEYYELPENFETYVSGLFAFPTPQLNRITSPFGYRNDPFDASKRTFHYGIDISGENAMGSPIISVRDGEVIQVNYSNGNAGYNVVIKHVIDENSVWTSRYCHMSQINVRVGQIVKMGDVIGAVGNTGRSTGPHLHFELKYNGQLVDPLRFIR